MLHDDELLAVSGLRLPPPTAPQGTRLCPLAPLNPDRTLPLLAGHRWADLPLVGTVVAGFPSPADDELHDTLSLDEYLIKNKAATYLLRVTGHSMQDAGILPGDLLLVERGTTPRDGDIVIARVDRAWTMKFFRQRGAHVFLEAAHQDYQPIHPQEELQVAAVVRAVIRKY